ncbi:MAG: hypothetical protein KAX49_17830 [Halanaerobiales bacterium]|nr:hypothetical protein [Halanaerobiales bacterium]
MAKILFKKPQNLKKKKILIAVPIYDFKRYCMSEFLENLLTLSAEVCIIDNSKEIDFFDEICDFLENKRRKADFQVEYIGNRFSKTDSSRLKLTETRNELRNYFLSRNFDFFLSLESDVILTQSQLDNLFKNQRTERISVALLERPNSDTIISKKIEYIPSTICQRFNYSFEELENKILNVKGCHLGCTLIPREILQKIPFRYEPSLLTHDDTFFSLDVIAKEYEIFCDGFIKPKHLFRQWEINGRSIIDGLIF